MTSFTLIIGLVIALLAIGFITGSFLPAIAAIVVSAWCMFAPGNNYVYPVQSIAVAFMVVCAFIVAYGTGRQNPDTKDMTVRALAAPGAIIGAMSIITPSLTWNALAWHAIAFMLAELTVLKMFRTFKNTHKGFEPLDADTTAGMPALKATQGINVLTCSMMLAIMLAHVSMMAWPQAASRIALLAW